MAGLTRKAWKGIVLWFLTAAILYPIGSVLAATEDYEPCVLTVAVKDGAGSRISIYRAAARVDDDGSWRYVGSYADCDIPLEEVIRGDGCELFEFTRQNGIEGRELLVDENEKAVFCNLKAGIYLVAQTGSTSKSGCFVPFTVALPYDSQAAGQASCRVTAKPKNGPSPDKQVVPVIPESPSLPQTGQLWWPIPVLAAGGAGLLIGAWITERKALQ